MQPKKRIYNFVTKSAVETWLWEDLNTSISRHSKQQLNTTIRSFRVLSILSAVCLNFSEKEIKENLLRKKKLTTGMRIIVPELCEWKNSWESSKCVTFHEKKRYQQVYSGFKFFFSNGNIFSIKFHSSMEYSHTCYGCLICLS